MRSIYGRREAPLATCLVARYCNSHPFRRDRFTQLYSDQSLLLRCKARFASAHFFSLTLTSCGQRIKRHWPVFSSSAIAESQTFAYDAAGNASNPAVTITSFADENPSLGASLVAAIVNFIV